MNCIFRRHRYKLIANLEDMNIRRGLYQCKNCKKVMISLASEFYDDRRRKNNQTKTPLEDGIYDD